MADEFSAQAVALEVVEHLERRRAAIVGDDARVTAEINAALEPVRRSYSELELPGSYLKALETELLATIPAKWLPAAREFTALEQRGFQTWRGGDVVARLSYVMAGLVVGGLILWAPFIPIWEKWFPFALSIAAWWLPDAQVAWHKRRYAKSLGAIAEEVGQAQRALDRHIVMGELMPGETEQEKQ